MMIAYRAGNRAVFLYGFAKSEQDNIGPNELRSLREIGSAWLDADSKKMARALEDGVLQEVEDDEHT
jgi:hypothetical protein